MYILPVGHSKTEFRKCLVVEKEKSNEFVFGGAVLEFSELNSPRDSFRSKTGKNIKAKRSLPGFRELDYQQESIDSLLKQVLKAKVDHDIVPVDDGQINSFVNGLINTNSACYLNVVLQTLVRVPGIKDYFLQNDYYSQLEHTFQKKESTLAERFGDFVKTYYAFNRKILEAEELKKFISKCRPNFNLNSQEDAHEFLLFMIEQMGIELNRSESNLHKNKFLDSSIEVDDYHNSASQVAGKDELLDVNKSTNLNLHPINNIPKKIVKIEIEKTKKAKNSLEELGCLKWHEEIITNASIFSDTLMGQLLSTIKCKTCAFKSHTFESFFMLELPVPKKSKATLRHCFEEYCKQETLDCKLWECPNCNERRSAEKTLEIWRMPPVLILNFKRFEQNKHGIVKNDCLVSININGEDLESFLAAGAKNSLPTGQSFTYQPFSFIVI